MSAKPASTELLLWSKIQGYILKILGITNQQYYKKIVDIVCDGVITKLLYRWLFSFLFVTFLSTWYCWYYYSNIVCKHSFSDVNIKHEDYLNICLSYPFVTDDTKQRRYILFYRWLPSCLLILASFCYTPRLLAKYFCNNMNELQLNFHKKNDDYNIVNTILSNLWGNNHLLYIKYLLINIYCLIIEVTSVIFLNFVLQERFIWFGYVSFPFNRDSQKFTDYISQTFPPFVDCNINDVHKIVLFRDETFGCHLTLMELYEKIFLILWALLFILILITTIYIAILLFICCPVLNEILFITPSTPRMCQKVKLPRFSIGDVYYLYCIKKCIPANQYYYIISSIVKNVRHDNEGCQQIDDLLQQEEEEYQYLSQNQANNEKMVTFQYQDE